MKSSDLPRAPLSARSLLALFAATALVSAGAQLWLLGAGRVAEFAPGLAYNIWALACAFVCFELLRRAPRPIGVLALFAVPLSFAAAGLVFAHSWFFDVAIERRLTVFDMTRAGVRYFFESALPAGGRVGLALCWGAIALFALLFARLSLPPLSGRAFAICSVALVALTPLVLRAPRIPSPLFDSTLELWEVAVRPKIVPSGKAPPEYLAALDKMERTRGAPPSAFDKVIVLVMETMTASNFERETRALRADTFLRTSSARVHSFDRYFPNNQDSRTGMLDMLFARLIPYEAYSDEGYEHYRHLAREPSLVDRMRDLGFETAFAVSQTTLEDVVAELPWQQTLRLSEQQIADARRAGRLCFTPDEYEQSCEDLALLPAVVDFVSTHERAFVYQEFIWGHASEYNEASGKSNARYYSEYVDALLSALAQRGLAERTLLAITSDHGFRDKGRQHELEVYRVPLLFHAPQLTARRDARLLSHVDFGMLLFERLTPRVPALAEDNPIVMIVGPTGQGHLFVVNRDGGSMLLRRKLGSTLLVAREGKWDVDPARLLATFEAYRRRFDRALSRAPR